FLVILVSLLLIVLFSYFFFFFFSSRRRHTRFSRDWSSDVCSSISVWDFVLAGIGSLPSEFLSAYAGRVTGEALALAEQAEVPKNASYYAVLLGGLAATVAATLLVTRTARRALRDV